MVTLYARVYNALPLHLVHIPTRLLLVNPRRISPHVRWDGLEDHRCVPACLPDLRHELIAPAVVVEKHPRVVEVLVELFLHVLHTSHCAVYI